MTVDVILQGSSKLYTAVARNQAYTIANNSGQFASITGLTVDGVPSFEPGIGPAPERRTIGPLQPGDSFTVHADLGQILVEFDELASAGDVTVTPSSDLLGRIKSIQSTHASIQIDETDPWDIHYWLTPTQIADSRSQTGPTINLTNQITYAHNQLLAKFVGQPNPANPGASRGMQLRFHHSYLVDGFSNWSSAVMIRGDSMRETIFVQSTTPTGHMFSVLADQGQASGGRASYWVAEQFSVQMKPTRVGPGATTGPTAAICHGIDFQAPADHLGYEAGLLNWVNVTGASGSGINVPLKRHGPKLRFCYVNGSGGVDTSVAQDDTGHYPNIFIGSDSDAELLHCGSGSGKGHSLMIHNCETAQVKGGDYWASSNASVGYRALFLDGFNYGIFEGFDCNGAIEYQGSGLTKSAQVRFQSINFRFRPSSFGGDNSDDPGFQPPPLAGYLILKNSVGSLSMGCHFTPSYDNTTGLVNARPRWRYYLTGNTMHHACDPLHDIQSNDWDCGANSDGTLNTATEQNSITNDWSKLTLHAPSISTSTASGSLMNNLRIPDGVSGGIKGRMDGTGAPSGAIGEQIAGNTNSGAAVGLTSGSPQNIKFITLTPGQWTIQGFLQFSSSASVTPTPSLVKGGLGITSGAITTTSPTAYASRGVNQGAIPVSTDFESLSLGPTEINVAAGTTQNFYLVARCNFTGGANAVLAYGGLIATRTA